MTPDLSSYTTPKLLLGLFGQNILKSLSPAMHQEEARHHGVNVFYHLMDFALNPDAAKPNELANQFNAAKKMGFAGLNITYPYKVAVLPLLDDICPDARAIGAVNTVVFKNGKSCGYNTDCSGYATALKAKLGERPLGRVVLVGTGGAGAAVAHGLMGLGAAHLTLVDTDLAKAQQLEASLAQRFGASTVSTAASAHAALQAADGLVNGTPLGMAGIGGMCVEPDWILPHHWVSDVVYSPLVTPMLAVAASKGCTTVDGGGMNLWQAVVAFEHFTGLTADAARMGRYHRALFEHRGM
jgi:shikimate dehydrogenase